MGVTDPSVSFLVLCAVRHCTHYIRRSDTNAPVGPIKGCDPLLKIIEEGGDTLECWFALAFDLDMKLDLHLADAS